MPPPLLASGILDPEAENEIKALKPKVTSYSLAKNQDPDFEDELLDASLAQVDVTKNTDKYYILQMISAESKSSGEVYYVYTRWGRTGTAG